MTKTGKVTIYDIAEYSGVSVATVNRALNDTGRISENTRKKVLNAAQELGYKANPAAQSLRRNPIHIGVLLCCPVDSYLFEIKRGIDSGFSALSQYNVFPDMRYIVGYNASDKYDEVSSVLSEFERKNYSGMILFLSGDTACFEKQLSAISAKIPIASIANDIGAGRIISVTADGVCAGMLAAELLNLCAPLKRAAVITGNLRTPIHASNINGFTAYAKNHGFKLCDIFEHDDDPEKFEKAVNEVFKSKKKYDGVYITSSVTTISADKLKTAAKESGIRIVTTDLYPEIRKLLEDEIISATIFQDQYKQGKTVVKRLYEYICEKTGEGDILLLPGLVFSSDVEKYPLNE